MVPSLAGEWGEIAGEQGCGGIAGEAETWKTQCNVLKPSLAAAQLGLAETSWGWQRPVGDGASAPGQLG